uniref:Potassium channel domain-containing protein n=1 Tax=Parascaris univalens TaxID=6257 RepID=A0A915B5S2_PARUN
MRSNLKEIIAVHFFKQTFHEETSSASDLISISVKETNVRD